jgi:hypothetical protein
MVGGTKIPSNFSFQKMSRKKNIIFFSFLCTKGFGVIISSMGESIKNSSISSLQKLVQENKLSILFLCERGMAP